MTAFDPVHDAFARRVENRELPGVVTLIAQGEAVHVDAIGATAFDGGEAMRRDTPFRIASMTKPVLAVATLILVEDGQLDLSSPIERWLPELANRRVLKSVEGPLDETVEARRPITLDDLLTFRFGFGQVFDPTGGPALPVMRAADELQLGIGPPDPRTPHTPDKWLELFGTLPLMYQPGERWIYNVGSLIVGALVARVAGESLGDFFQRRIFEPLGMRTTGFWLPAEVAQRLPSYYTTNFRNGKLEQHHETGPELWSSPPAFPSGAGGLASTVDDYLRFARMLLNRGAHPGGRLLSEHSIEQMTTNQLTPEQMATAGPLLGGQGWGYGVGIVTEPGEAWPVPGRYGWMGGYGTTWFNDPHRGIVAMAMTQVTDVLWNGTFTEFDTLVAGI